MNARDLVQALTWLLFLAVFLLVAAQAVRSRRRAATDAALFFGAPALAILYGRLVGWTGLEPSRVGTAISGSLVMALPYLLLRILEDFSGPRPAARIATEAGLVLSVAALAVLPPPLPAPALVPMVVYFAAVTLYVSAAFVRQAVRESGVTRRRLGAAAGASGLLGVTLLLAGAGAVLPQGGELLGLTGQVAALGSAAGYVLAFVPPAMLRHAWQYPELRAFVERTGALPALPDAAEIRAELERLAGSIMARGEAALGLWDEAHGELIYAHHPLEGNRDGGALGLAPNQFLGGTAFLAQRPIFVPDVASTPFGESYRAGGIRSVMAAPITAGGRRLGVLSIYSPYEPIFGEDDLELLGALAAQCGTVLETHRLLRETSALAAREQASRLKEDFVSAAAHDLKTPLTTVLAQLQRLQRRVRRGEPVEAGTLDLLLDETRRLDRLVNSLLDLARYEEGRLVVEAEPLEVEAPALVLLDMRMPVMDGWEFARRLVQRDSPPPVVVMTAARDARAWAEEIGAAAYVAKPFELEDLVATVAAFAGER